MFGIDVSKWNGKNDFDRAKKEGVEFVIISSSFLFVYISMFKPYQIRLDYDIPLYPYKIT